MSKIKNICRIITGAFFALCMTVVSNSAWAIITIEIDNSGEPTSVSGGLDALFYDCYQDVFCLDQQCNNTIEDGEEVSVPNGGSGYTFNGYYLDEYDDAQFVDENGIFNSTVFNQYGVASCANDDGQPVPASARWTASGPCYTHRLILDKNGGDPDVGTSYLYFVKDNGIYYNENCTGDYLDYIVNPKREGYSFEGYYYSSGSGQVFDSTGEEIDSSFIKQGMLLRVSSDQTIVAHWTWKGYYIITLNPNDGTSGSPTVMYAVPNGSSLISSNDDAGAYYTVSPLKPTWNSGGTYTQMTDNGFTMPTRSGYTFLGFYSAATGGTQYINASGWVLSALDTAAEGATGNFTVYAHWGKDCDAGTYLKGSNATCTACPAGKYCTGGSYAVDGSDHGITGDIAAGYWSAAGAGTQYGGGGVIGHQNGFISGGYYSAGGAKTATPTSSSDCTSGQCGQLSAGYYCDGGCTSSGPVANGNGCVSGFTCGACLNGFTTYGVATIATQCYKTGSIACSGVMPYSLGVKVSDASPVYQTITGTEQTSNVTYKQYQKNATEADILKLENPLQCIPVSLSCRDGLYAQVADDDIFNHDIPTSAPGDSGYVATNSFDNNQFELKYSGWSLYGTTVKNATAGSSTGATMDSFANANSGTYCWVRITGAKSSSDTVVTPVMTPWIYVGNASTGSCIDMAAGANGLKSSTIWNAVRNNRKQYRCAALSFYTVTLNTNGGNAVNPSTVYTRIAETSGDTYAGVYSTYANALNHVNKLDGLTVPTGVTGYTFAGYFSATTGGTKYVDADGSFTNNAKNNTHSTWYAQWTANSISITWYGVTSGAGGDSNGVKTSSVSYGGDITTPAAVIIANTGQSFLGWKFEK